MHKQLLLILMGMVLGAGLFATGVACGTAYATRHSGDECDEPDSGMARTSTQS